jgi:hypothetical protein
MPAMAWQPGCTVAMVYANAGLTSAIRVSLPSRRLVVPDARVLLGVADVDRPPLTLTIAMVDPQLPCDGDSLGPLRVPAVEFAAATAMALSSSFLLHRDDAELLVVASPQRSRV